MSGPRAARWVPAAAGWPPASRRGGSWSPTWRCGARRWPALPGWPAEGVSMARSGLVVVDKPAGWTSHDVVARIRRVAGTRRVGHAGTLDPMATGVLLVGVERATRLLCHLAGSAQHYQPTVP